MLRTINGKQYIQFNHMNAWVEIDKTKTLPTILEVYSYDTLIGYIYRDNSHADFITWGYRTYSCTTSKQITTICNQWALQRCDVDGKFEALKTLSRHITKYNQTNRRN